MNLITQHQVFSAKDILEGSFTLKNKHIQTAIDFCKAWLSGKEVYRLHTSGSTGRPKPITIHRTQMLASATLTQKVIPLDHYQSALVPINTAFVGGTMMLVRGMLFDWDIYLVEPSSNPFVGYPLDTPLDFMAVVPLQLYQILSNPASSQQLLAFESVIVGGGAVSYELQQMIQKHPTPIYHTYGMTETVSHIALQKLNTKFPDKAFEPIEGVSIWKDERGCLVIESPTSVTPVVTNDLVEIQTDGSFHILGRIDNVVNSGGIKIQLESVERRIDQIFLENKLKNPFYLKGEKDSILGSRLVLCIEAEALDSNMILEKLRVLPKYHIPKVICIKKSFERTSTGKIIRS